MEKPQLAARRQALALLRVWGATLDSASGAQVMELVRQLHDSGSTIIMITHDQGIAHHADTIMTIKDGVLSGGGNDE